MTLVLVALVRSLNLVTAKSKMPITKENNTKTVEKGYYFENGFCVFTSEFLKKRGYCCGNGCRHCPYQPKHTFGNKVLSPEFVQKL